jgi:peptidoglycan/LPS O-acetylase OafA/YrhL
MRGHRSLRVYDSGVAFRLGYRPALDGVRGLAILTVMLVHTGLPFASGGFLSVDVFFVLSGFLITSVLVEESGKTGAIDLRNFYVRRALRLLPALAVLLFALTIFSLRMPVPASAVEVRREILFTAFYVTNWALAFGAMPAMGLLGHGWTLAIEEQFYFVWPVVLMLLLRARLSRQRIAVLVAAAIAAGTLYRVVLWQIGVPIDRLFFGFDTRCDSLLAGCLGALLVSLPGRDAASPGVRLVQPAAFAAVAVILAMVATLSHDHPFMYAGGFTLVAAAAAVVLMAVVDAPGSVLARILASRPLVHAGHISYGLYLWHWPVFLYFTPSLHGWPETTGNVVRFGMTIVMAELSAVLIEQPFLRLKKRWS